MTASGVRIADNSKAGNDMQGFAGDMTNQISHKPFAANRLRGDGRDEAGQSSTEIEKNSTRWLTLVRWCKFNLVGAIGILVQFAALFLLKSALHLNYLAATGLAVEAAVVHNFVWHERFTWADRVPNFSGAKAQDHLCALFAALKRCATQNPHATQKHSVCGPSFRRFLRFNLTTGVVSIFGNVGMMRVMVGVAHMNYLLANAVAIAVCSLVNFQVSDGWVFGE
ncbi:MAG TPA: GtrA family protein [Candidatus Sulfotelmatobacter sp.]|nr:GtrA family protein [Candidatus Sulfotelmatobacter sp.]